MDHIASHDADSGFSLWLESDMLPIKSDWVDRLAQLWHDGARPLMMGLLVPTLDVRLSWRRWKHVPEHLNGGACYAKDFSRHFPEDARHDAFDVAVFPYLKRMGKVKSTRAFGFATRESIARNICNPERAVLHGWGEDKDAFIADGIRCWHDVQEGKAPRKFSSRLKKRCCEHARWSLLGYSCPLHLECA